MGAVRRLIGSHAMLAALICAAALALRLLVPAGYMVSGEGGRVAVTLCPGTAPMPAMHGAMPGHGDPAALDHADSPCAFAGLAVPTTGAVEAVLPILAPALAAARALPSMRPRGSGTTARLRPPLRGPPRR